MDKILELECQWGKTRERIAEINRAARSVRAPIEEERSDEQIEIAIKHLSKAMEATQISKVLHISRDRVDHALGEAKADPTLSSFSQDIDYHPDPLQFPEENYTEKESPATPQTLPTPAASSAAAPPPSTAKPAGGHASLKEALQATNKTKMLDRTTLADVDKGITDSQNDSSDHNLRIGKLKSFLEQIQEEKAAVECCGYQDDTSVQFLQDRFAWIGTIQGEIEQAEIDLAKSIKKRQPENGIPGSPAVRQKTDDQTPALAAEDGNGDGDDRPPASGGVGQ